jgi:hypothetical protein
LDNAPVIWAYRNRRTSSGVSSLERQKAASTSAHRCAPWGLRHGAPARGTGAPRSPRKHYHSGARAARRQVTASHEGVQPPGGFDNLHDHSRRDDTTPTTPRAAGFAGAGNG